jgi:predicted RNase H-like nuclease (RuvC/YqgF family)
MIRKINVKYLLGVFMLALLAASANQPQSLDDWKAALSAAQSGKGCESIPYSGYRDECTRKSDKVNELCKTDSWSCDGLETKSLRENIKNLSEYIERLKTEKDRLNSQKSSAVTDDEKNETGKKIEETEKQIYDKTKELDFMKKSLETDLSDIEIRLYKGNQCLDARTDVQKAFAGAVSDAKRESDPDIKAIANQLIDYWEKRAKEHEEAFNLVKQGLEKCQKSKSGDL